jgi:ATP-dependent DNA helicase RecQ
MEALLKEMEQIVYSGTKLNIKYWIDEMLDDEQQEEIMITSWNQSPIR